MYNLFQYNTSEYNKGLVAAAIIDLLLSDSFSMSDVVDATTAINLLLTDSLSTSDDISRLISLLLTDSLSTSDTVSKLISLLLIDSFLVSDEVSKLLSLLQTESFSIDDTIFIKRVLELILTDLVDIVDIEEISKALTLRLQEAINLIEIRKLSILCRLRDDFSFVEERRIQIDVPIGWWIGEPINPNFSFSNDTNQDGIADDWSFINLEVGKCELIKDGHKPSVQKIKFDSGGEIKQSHILIGKYAIYFEIKPKDFMRFEILQNGISIYNKRFRPSINWVEFGLDFNFNGNIEFKFYSGYAECYLDNFVIMKYSILDDFIRKKKVAPESFSYVMTGDEVEEGLLQTNFIKKEILTSFAISWSSLMDYSQKEWMKSLIGKNIFVRSSVEEAFAFLVTELIQPPTTYEQGLDQKYHLSLMVREV